MRLHEPSKTSADALLRRLRDSAPQVTILENDLTAPTLTYRLGTENNAVVKRVLRLVRSRQLPSDSTSSPSSIESYDVVGPSLEDVFLKLMAEQPLDRRISRLSVHEEQEPSSLSRGYGSAEIDELPTLKLSDGKQTSFITQTYIIFYKRCLIAKTAWHTPALMLVLLFAGTTLMLAVLKRPQGYGLGWQEERLLEAKLLRL